MKQAKRGKRQIGERKGKHLISSEIKHTCSSRKLKSQKNFISSFLMS